MSETKLGCEIGAGCENSHLLRELLQAEVERDAAHYEAAMAKLATENYF